MVQGRKASKPHLKSVGRVAQVATTSATQPSKPNSANSGDDSASDESDISPRDGGSVFGEKEVGGDGVDTGDEEGAKEGVEGEDTKDRTDTEGGDKSRKSARILSIDEIRK